MNAPVRDALKRKETKRRYDHESTHIGGFEMLFPNEDPKLHTKYEKILKKSTELFEEHVSDNKRYKLMMRELKLKINTTGMHNTSLSSESQALTPGKLAQGSTGTVRRGADRISSHSNFSFSF